MGVKIKINFSIIQHRHIIIITITKEIVSPMENIQLHTYKGINLYIRI